MGKLITILGGCVVVAGGISYGLYTSHHGCPFSGPAVCPHAATVESDCCEHSARPVNTSAGDEGGCPLAAAAKATCPAGTSAGDDGCCEHAALACNKDAGLTAVAGAALSAGGK